MLDEHTNIFLCFVHFLRSPSNYGKHATVLLDFQIICFYGFPPVVPVCSGWNAPRTRWWGLSTETRSQSGSGRSPPMTLVKWLKSPPCWLAWVMTPRQTRPSTQSQRPCCRRSAPHRWVTQSFKDFLNFLPVMLNFLFLQSLETTEAQPHTNTQHLKT